MSARRSSAVLIGFALALTVWAVPGASASTWWYRDADGDGYGDPGNVFVGEEPQPGYVADGTDCYDQDPTVHPGATEVADGQDNDCDGQIDEGLTDQDQDGITDADGDCDDHDPDVYPGAPHLPDGKDNDCDGATDRDEKLDSDLDGHPDDEDNCPVHGNGDQADFDEDGAGDVCDEDDDADGLSDAAEAARGTDPFDADSDDDGLDDGAEAHAHGSDPLDADTDGDLFADGTEVGSGSDPANPFSVPLPTGGSVTLTNDPPVDELPTDDLDPLV